MAVAALAVGLGAAIWQWDLSRRPAPPAPEKPADPVGEDVIRHALEQAGIPADDKSRWVDQVPGVELAALTGSHRERFLRFANAQRCTCGCGYTLGACRNYDAQCEVSLPRVQALFDSVRRGLAGSTAGVRERPPGGGRGPG
jgi:hypothetical protein